MSRIGFMDLSLATGHHETLTRYLRMAAHGDGSPMLFTSSRGLEKARDGLSNRSFREHVGAVSRSYLQSVERICEDELDILFINTFDGPISHMLEYQKFDPDCKIVFWPHMARAWFEGKLVLTRAVDLRTLVSYNLKNLLRPKILEHVDGILMPFEQSAEYIRDRYHPEQQVHSLTPVVCEGERPKTSDTDTVRITIPGSVVNRRDYTEVLDAFERNLFPTFGDEIELVLLGRPTTDYGEKILDRVRNLEADFPNVRYYTEWISTEEYSLNFASSDIVVNPIVNASEERSERWGKTWNSGVLFDALIHGTPLILPNEYDVPDEVAPFTKTYGKERNLTSVLNDLISDVGLRDSLTRAAANKSKEFDICSQHENLGKICDEQMSI